MGNSKSNQTSPIEAVPPLPDAVLPVPNPTTDKDHVENCNYLVSYYKENSLRHASDVWKPVRDYVVKYHTTPMWIGLPTEFGVRGYAEYSSDDSTAEHCTYWCISGYIAAVAKAKRELALAQKRNAEIMAKRLMLNDMIITLARPLLVLPNSVDEAENVLEYIRIHRDNPTMGHLGMLQNMEFLDPLNPEHLGVLRGRLILLQCFIKSITPSN